MELGRVMGEEINVFRISMMREIEKWLGLLIEQRPASGSMEILRQVQAQRS